MYNSGKKGVYVSQKAVVILSGGMDSTLCGYLAKEMGYDIIALHFNYHQRTQAKELEAFEAICGELKPIETYVIDLDFFAQVGASALIDSSIAVPTGGIGEGVPVTYVPFRNGIFLSIATAITEKHAATAIFIGVVQEDSSGYPDCHEHYIQNMQQAINSGTKEETKIEICMPLVHLKKSQIVQEALRLNVPLHYTWSCYQNQDKACGVCDSCRLRLKGFEEANVRDAIEYL